MEQARTDASLETKQQTPQKSNVSEIKNNVKINKKTTTEELKKFWNCIDKIVCINLQERTDRKKKVLKLFERLGISDRVMFYQPNRDPKGGVRGCAESHFAIMRQTYDEGHRNVLIFEDDPDELTRPTKKTLAELLHFLANPDISWDMLTLGVFPRIFFKRTSTVAKNLLIGKKKYETYKTIRRVHSICSHSYIASRAFMQKMYPLRFETLGIPIDNIYEQNLHTYGLFPTWFYQTNSPTNIARGVLGNNTLRQMFVSSMNTYASDVNVPLVYFVILFVIILIFFVILLAVYYFRSKKTTKKGA